MERITILVCEFYGVDFEALFENSRGNQKQTIAKSMAIVFILEFLPTTLVATAKYFNRTHATIKYLNETMRGEMRVNNLRKKEYLDFKEKIKEMEFTYKNKKIRC